MTLVRKHPVMGGIKTVALVVVAPPADTPRTHHAGFLQYAAAVVLISIFLGLVVSIVRTILDR